MLKTIDDDFFFFVFKNGTVIFKERKLMVLGFCDRFLTCKNKTLNEFYFVVFQLIDRFLKKFTAREFISQFVLKQRRA